ncbi:hypothetical protein [Desulfosporosinus sp. BICA1-9]|uniref:hypothetical protein n=1 Tax=Desulfosporosinus sp. BICA1-9 TaxID=1531958 RepID=UPI00054C0131|nr:hypothetical protein [Desulfosporosinus sp. BICA1-9]KJS48950.1 MAG: hypothetical protein VR66_11250 [Peptococcaceae bacterium BRH_c23]KJS84030.1 MAG: hypothetical protein JL57_21575 [Desulfosporosinus sp. BICA1-9]HBW33880.1 hypothetical protein [Desulfosporosinus sp.]
MSVVRNKKTFGIGVALLVSFVLVYVGMMSPNFGNGRNGLEYADDMFNSLSKGSAYFMKDAQKVAESQKGKNINLTVKASSPADAEKWGELYTTAGATVTVKESSVTIDGDFGKILGAVVADSDLMYHNDSKTVEAKYGYDGREATYNWNSSLKKIDAALKAKSQFLEGSALLKVQQKALEPGYNYYGVEIKKVSENKGSLIFLLSFYLAYTLWYGFGLFYLFDGLGIVVGKSKKKVA